MSRSSELVVNCIAGAVVFSGRPDPTWEVDEGVVKRLEGIWATLRPSARNRPPAPTLGYRGCFLTCGLDREWLAYGGVVTLKTPGKDESRADDGREFEKALLGSAPQGTLPDWVL